MQTALALNPAYDVCEMIKMSIAWPQVSAFLTSANAPLSLR